MSDAYPKKYWWLVLIVVPLLGAVIAIVPSFFDGDTPPAGQTYISNTKFSGDLHFASVDVILNEYQQAKGEPLTDQALTQEIVRGVNLVKGGDYEAAVQVFEDIADKAGLPSVYNNLGVLRALNDDYDASRAAYRKAIEKNPDLQPVQYNLGLLEQQQGRIEEAVRHLEKASTVPKARKLVTTLKGETKAGTAEGEPNNNILTPNQVTELDAWIQGSIGGVDDVDFYHFITPETYRDIIQVVAENHTTTLKPQLTLWGSDKSYQRQSARRAHHVTAGQNAELTFSSNPKTEYYLSVAGFGTQGQYRLKIAPLKKYDDYEPNDQILEAKPISLDSPISASIMDGSDVDFYEIKTSKNAGSVSIALDNQTTSLRPHIKLWSSRKEYLQQSARRSHHVTAGQDATLAREAEPNSVYYVSVGGFGTEGDYRLTVRHEGE